MKERGIPWKKKCRLREGKQSRVHTQHSVVASLERSRKEKHLDANHQNGKGGGVARVFCDRQSLLENRMNVPPPHTREPLDKSVSPAPLSRADALFFPLSSTMAPVASWSLVDYQQHPPIRSSGPNHYGRLRHQGGSNQSNSLKSYGSVSSFESDPYASLMSVHNPPNKPPRAQQPPSSSGRLFHPHQGNAAANRSKSHSDLV